MGKYKSDYIDSLSNLLEIIQVGQNGKLTNVISIVDNGSGIFSLFKRFFALKADGTVWGWGSNGSGQLGDGTNIDQLTPVKVVGLSNVISIVSEASDTVVLKDDGTVWAWGSNGHGYLGDGTRTDNYTPTQINGLINITAIGKNDIGTAVDSAGFYAINNDETLWVWGCQANEILDHTTWLTCPDSPRTPTQLSGFSDVIDFKSRAVGDLLNSYYVLKSDGTVWSWGNNLVGQLGDGTNSNKLLPHGTTGTNRDAPLQVAELTGVKDIQIAETLGGMIVFALKEDGTVWAWGDNSGRKLGTEMTTSTVDSPTQVSGLTDITKIAIETFHRLALKNDGTVWAWGDNNISGAIGVGDIISPPRPPIQLVDLNDVIDITVSFNSSYALKEDGTIWGWGSGQLVDGTSVTHFTPTQMCTLSGVTNIVSLRMASSPYLLRNDGTVWNGYFDVCTQL